MERLDHLVVPFLALAEGLLHGHRRGDVAPDDVDEPATRAGDGVPLEQAVGPVGASAADAQQDGSAARVGPREPGDRRCQIIGMDEVEDWPAQKILLRVAKGADPRRVDPLEVAVGPDDPEQIERCLEEGRQVMRLHQ